MSYEVYILGVRGNFRGNKLFGELLKLGLEPKIVWGPEIDIDVNMISDLTNYEYSKFTIKREIKAQEIACCIGHIRMYREFLTSNSEWGLFLEDDAILLLDPTPLLQDLTQLTCPVQIFIHDGPGTDLPVAFKEHAGISEANFVKKLDPQYGAYGYLLNRCAAEEVLKSKISTYINTPDWPYLWPTNISFYHSKKTYISHPEDHSMSIIGERINAEAKILNLLPSLLRVVRGMKLGLSFSDLIKREIVLKFRRLFLQLLRKVSK